MNGRHRGRGLNCFSPSESVGMSRPTLHKAQLVMRAANSPAKMDDSGKVSEPVKHGPRPRHLNIRDSDHEYLERRGEGNASRGLHLICRIDRMWREKIHNLRQPFVIWADQFERTGDIDAAKLLRNLERQLGQWETEAEGPGD